MPPCRIYEKHQRKPDIETEHCELYPKDAASGTAERKFLCGSERHIRFDRPNGKKKAVHQKRQAKFLRTVAVFERRAGINKRSGGGKKKINLLFPDPKPHEPCRKVQEKTRTYYFNQINADKISFRNKPRKPVNKIKQRTFLLINIAIKHRTVEHCAPCRKKALGIHPIVDGIEEGRAAANGYDKKSHGKAEQKQPPQFASLIGFAEKNEIQARYLAIQPVYYITIFPQLQLCRKKVKNCSGFNDWLHSAHKITLMRMSV